MMGETISLNRIECMAARGCHVRRTLFRLTPITFTLASEPQCDRLQRNDMVCNATKLGGDWSEFSFEQVDSNFRFVSILRVTITPLRIDRQTCTNFKLKKLQIIKKKNQRWHDSRPTKCHRCSQLNEHSSTRDKSYSKIESKVSHSHNSCWTVKHRHK